MLVIERKYRIWRMVAAYVAVLRQNLMLTLGRLFAVAAIDLGVTYLSRRVQFANPILSIGFSLLWNVAAWVPLVAYMSIFSFDALKWLGISAKVPRDRFLPLLGLAIAGSLCVYFIVFVMQIFRLPEIASWGLLTTLVSYAGYAWFILAIPFVIEGVGFLRSIGKSMGFIWQNVGKIIVFLLLALLFHLLLGIVAGIAIPDVLGRDIFYKLVNFLVVYETVLYFPIVIIIYIKLNHFPDPPKIELLRG